jgi:hypothetical protein
MVGMEMARKRRMGRRACRIGGREKLSRQGEEYRLKKSKVNKEE